MVSTHQQYLCPEFLNPLPSTSSSGDTTDSSKSPLALLAQTCNSIGLPDLPADKGNVHEANGDDAPSAWKTTDDDDASAKAPAINGKRCAEAALSIGKLSKQDGLLNGHVKVKSPGGGKDRHSTAQALPPSIGSCTVSSAAAASQQAPQPCPWPTAGHPYAAFVAPHLSPTSLACGANPFASAAAFNPALFTGALSYPCYAGGLSSRYPRPCTDPFCKTCPALGGRATCPFGCSQCAAGVHGAAELPSSLWLNPYAPLLAANLHGALPGAAAAANGNFASLANALSNPSMSSLIAAQTMSIAAAAAAAACASANNSGAPATTTAQHQAYVCNWYVDQYCGKKFSSGDELLQHLRSHATQDALKSSTTPASSSRCQRTPTATSTAAATPYSRFHPYGKVLAPSSLANYGLSTSLCTSQQRLGGASMPPQP